MKALHVSGTVFSGKGEGARFVKLRWVREQIAEKMDFHPYLGTLNVRLFDKDGMKLRKTLNRAQGIDILPPSGFCRGRCFKAYLRDRQECAVVIPEVAAYPENVIELVASANLRKRLDLKDGDVVDVSITV